MRGPYGTNEGDKWLGIGSPIQERLDAEEDDKPTDGQHRTPRRYLIHEMMVKGGELAECVYVTTNPELIAEATAGHEKWLAAQAVNN